MNNRSFFSHVIWILTGLAGFIILRLLTALILARLLTPESFGIMGIAMFFVGISKVLIEFGIGGVWVRKPDVKGEDYSTVFVFNFLLSLSLSIILFFFPDISQGFIINPF